MSTREQALWTRTRLGRCGPPLDLLTARFDRHVYAPHAHDEYTIGVCVGGSELIDYRGGHIRTGPGSIVVLAPGEIHTGGPGTTTDGYAYRALYAAPTLLADGSAALTGRHSTSRVTTCVIPGADAVARVVRDRLADELLSPPTLSDLAADLGLSRYQLLRAFRTTMGVPPYAWLAQYRVGRARTLLESGRRPSEVAALVGFADQAHLTRWFRRVLGVTPAAYRNSVQDTGR
jgi:AraC-like DNA-binding protein